MKNKTLILLIIQLLCCSCIVQGKGQYFVSKNKNFGMEDPKIKGTYISFPIEINENIYFK